MRFGVESKMEGEYVAVLIAQILYCLVVQASFYGDKVVFASHAEGRGFDPQSGQTVFSIFSPVTFILTGGLRQQALNSQRTRLTYRELGFDKLYVLLQININDNVLFLKLY